MRLPGLVARLGGQRVGELHHHLAARRGALDRDLAASRGGLDAVVDGVLHQRLQHERRNQGVGRHLVDPPRHPQALAQAQRLDGEVLARERHLGEIGASVRLSAMSTRKSSAMSSSTCSARRGSVRTSERPR
jgi:hypothetical protein